MRSTRALRTCTILLSASILFGSCSKDSTAPAPPVTYSMAIVSGSGQSDTVGATISLPLVVRVADSDGQPAAGMVVDFKPSAGSGSVSVDSAITDADGRAQTLWTLGTSEGEAQLRAALRGQDSLDATFVATVKLPPLRAVALAAGMEHNCAITSAHELYCWGSNGSGQLGDGTLQDRNTAGVVPGTLRFEHVAAGAGHTCAITTEAELYCWGRNVWGQVGDGSTATRKTPVHVAPDLHFSDVAAGLETTCGLTTSGAVYCWGFMDGTQSATYWEPANVSGGTLFRSLVASSLQVCGIGVDGKPYCLASTWVPDTPWGGGALLWRPQPAPAATFTSFAGGLNFMCGLDAGGAAFCWGNNDYGQLGDGTTDPATGVVPVGRGLLFRGLYSGYDWSCGVTVAGPTYCWGHNSWGVVGPVVDQHYVEPTPRLLATPDGLTFAVMGGGFYHMCGIGSDTLVYCWGGGFSGQLGDAHSVADFYHTAMPTPVVRR